MLKQRLLPLLIASALSTSVLAAPAPTYPNESTAPVPAKASRAGADVATGVIGVLLLWGLMSALNSDPASNDSPRATWRNRQRDGSPSASPETGPDTSAGCAWGDRAYGTCH